jgi:hypothetical protein
MPAPAQVVSESNAAPESRAGGDPHDQPGHSAEALRLAAAALRSPPGGVEAGVVALQDAVARQEQALLAFGNLLVANVKDTSAQTEALNKLVHYQTSSWAKLENLLQIALLKAWSDELAKPRYADPKRLTRHGFKVYSQCDEDGIIQEIFKRIGTTNRVFVEFGVESGSECNSVKLLLEGWRGLWLEGALQYREQIVAQFRPFLENRRLAVTLAFITAENINDLIGQNDLLGPGGLRGEIDLLSVDIDYNDYWVWKAIDVISPRVVVIEYNATLRPPLSLVVPYDAKATWQGSNYHGASLEALVRFGDSKGYRLVGCNYAGSNAFFVRKDLTKDLFLEPATAEEHYEPLRTFFSHLQSGHPPQPGVYLTV